MNIKEYLPYYKRNLMVAIPIMLSQLGGAIVMLADSIMVGRLGTISLAAVSFAGSVHIFGFIAGSATLIGATPLVGYAFVRGDHERASRLFQNALLLSVGLSALLIALLTGTAYLMPFMGQEAAVVEEATGYYHLVNLSLLPFFLFCAFRQFFEGIGNTKVSMTIIITTNLINILLNYLFIFGRCGAPQMGIEGAGLATLVARILMPIMFLGVMLWRTDWKRYLSLFRQTHFGIKPIVDILKVGLPISGHQLMEFSAFALSTIFAGWISATTQASHMIAQNIGHMAFMLVLGLSSATIIRVSHQYGIRDMQAVKMAASASLHLGIMLNSMSALTIILLRQSIPTLFSSDPEVLMLAPTLLMMVGFFQLSDGMQAVSSGILRGLSDVNMPIKYAFFAYLVINIPLGLLFAFPLGMGAPGLWLSLIIGLTVAAILLYRRVRIQISRLLIGKALLK